MAIFMLTVWFPLQKGIDVGKLYLKRPREIPFVTKWRAFNTAGGLKGSKQYHLIYTERGKGEEAWLEVQKYFLPLINEIEGFKIDMEYLVGVTDSMKAVGMQW